MTRLTETLRKAAPAALAAAVCAAALFFYTLIQPINPAWIDLQVFLETGRNLWSGESLYSWAHSGEGPVFLYPPAFAAIWAPLSRLPDAVAVYIWAGLVLWVAVTGVWRLCGAFAPETGPRARFFVMSLAMVAPVFLRDLTYNGANLLITGLVAHAVCDLRSRAWARCGLLLALAVHTKFLPIVLAPLLLTPQWRRAFAWFVSGLVAWNLLVLPFAVGAHGLAGVGACLEMPLDYLRTLVVPRAQGLDASVVAPLAGGNLSFPGTAGRLGAQWLGVEARDWFARAGFCVAAALYLAALLASWKRRGEPAPFILAWGLCLMAAVMGNVSTLPHHLVPLLLCMVPVVAAQSRWRAYGVAVALYAGVYAPAVAWLADPQADSIPAAFAVHGGIALTLAAVLGFLTLDALRPAAPAPASQ